MKILTKLLFTIVATALLCFVVAEAGAQTCQEQPTAFPTPQPSLCQQAPNSGNMVPYFTQCRTICFDNTGVGASNQTADLSCLGGTQPANDLFLYANNPYAQIPGYDGSLVFRWVDWPGASTGALPPYFAVHGEVRATVAGITAQNIDCTDGFALENAICLEPADVEGNQFFVGAGTIPTLAQLEPIVDAIAGVNVTVADVSFWIQIATSNGAQGPICVEVSPYQSGFLCGDAETVALNGSGNTLTGSAATRCLCANALYGGIGNVANNFTPPCGIESSASAWYKINVPFGCNAITASVNNWGGSDDYNIAILRNVNCPGSSGTNPITGDPTFVPGQTMAPGASIVASGCSQPASTACSPVSAGEYYIVVSGKTERPTFELSVTVENVGSTIGTASSPQNGANVCSGATMDVSTSGSNLPLAATCGQDIAWFYSTNLAFNPYNGQGTYLGSGTSTNFALPANTSCTPRTYYVKGVISDNGTTAVAGCRGTTNALSVTVYPEIGTVTVNRAQCLITVATRCSNFTVNGNPGIDNFIASFADDGSVQDFLISNGLPACNIVVSDTVSCSGNCTQPVVTGTSKCDPNDPFNFYVDVNFTPGSAATYFIKDSDGGALAVSAAGTYTVGPFRNGSSIFISVENNDDANCNIPVGSFSDDCNTIVCPNLTSASTTVGGDVCEGSQTILQAFVDQGTLNQDFTVQWFRDGVAIPGATQLSAIHTFAASQGCSPEAQEFTIRLTCQLQGGSPSSTTFLNAGTVVVYPKPKLGRDFIQDPTNCTLAPIDNCGSLNITYTPQNNPSPGAAPTTVNYTVSVPGAPTGCNTTGSYVVNCPAATCSSSAGSGIQPADSVYCFGESFDIETAGASLGTGYTLAWAATTTPPYNDLNGAVANAIANQTIEGPDTTSNGSTTYTFTNGTDYGPGRYYFVPFVAMESINASNVAFQQSGTLNAPFGQSTVTATISIPDLAYCNGITTFDIQFVANQTSGVGNPIDGVSGILTYSGGSTTSVNLRNTNFTANPSGQSITISASSFFGANVNYTLTVRYNNSVTFPTICPSCNDVGTPIVVNLLPDITLASIAAPTVCDGEVIDLTDLNPTANLPGTYTWYDGVPGGGGSVIANADSLVPVSGTTYYVEFAATADTTCSEVASVTINTTPAPSLNPIPAQPAICFGETVDLTLLENGITTAPGSFIWYKGDPANNGIRLPTVFAENLAPIAGQDYFAVFESLASGCTNKVSVSFTVNPLPLLTGVPRQKLCAAGTFDLTSLEADYTTDPGTFSWYAGDPDTGAVLLTPAQAANITPDSGDVYFVVFEDATSGCSAKSNVGFDVFPDPVLVTPTPAAICAGDVVDLTALNQSIISVPGTFEWYLGDPNAGGTLLTQQQAEAQIPTGTETYYVVFTNIITTCSATTSFSYTVNLSPALATINPTICDGDTVDLSTLETDLLTGFTGTFTYYFGNPDTGAAELTALQVSAQVPDGSEEYYVVFESVAGCTDTTSFGFVVNPVPVLTPIPAQDVLCFGFSDVDLTALESGITTDAGTFDWYLGSPDTGTLITSPASVTVADGQTYFALFTEPTNGCSASVSVTFDVAAPITGVSATYDCLQDQLVVNLSGASGGAGGYTIAPDSPNENGDILASGATWTVYVTDTIGCRDTITGSVPCIVCDAGDGVLTGNNILCCDETVQVNNTGATLDVNRVTAWGLTAQADGPITSEAEAFAALANFRGDTAGNLLFEHDCNYPAGVYYLTPYISVKPNDNEPIVYDTLAGCRPTAEICPTISGTGWVINPMILTFPDGSTYNVNQEIAFGLPIDQALLDAVTGGVLPCLDLTSIYPGDPNGTWNVSITNTGSGALSFSVPDFNVIVDADSCSLITQDQVVSVAAVSGTISAGATNGINIVLPPPAVTAPPVTYDTLAGCRPTAVICPGLSGTGWVIDPMIITFPDGSTYNVNQEQAFGLPIDQALLDAVTGGSLPCLDLTSIYPGDPNGTWSVSITNTGTGSLSFTIPPFNIVVESDSCSLLSQDEVTQMSAVNGTIQGGGSNVIDIVIPPPAVTFPSIDSGCEDYGDPVELVLLNPISYSGTTVTCTDTATNTFEVRISGLNGGAPEVFGSSSYVFSEAATFDSSDDTWVVTLSNVTFPYDITVSNDTTSVSGNDCGAVITVATDPCQDISAPVLESLTNLSVYPNPSEGRFNLEAELKEATQVEIVVLNVLGEEVLRISEFSNAGQYRTVLDMSNHAEGMYLINITAGKQHEVRRVVRN